VLSDSFFLEGLYSERNFTFESGGGTDPRLGSTMVRDYQNGIGFNGPAFCSASAETPYCTDETRNNKNYCAEATWFVNARGTHDLVFGYDHFDDMRKADNWQTPSGYGYAPFAAQDYSAPGNPLVVIPTYGGWILWGAVLEASQGNSFVTDSLIGLQLQLGRLDLLRLHTETVAIDQSAAAVGSQGKQGEPDECHRDSREAEDAEADAAVVAGEPAHPETDQRHHREGDQGEGCETLVVGEGRLGGGGDLHQGFGGAFAGEVGGAGADSTHHIEQGCGAVQPHPVAENQAPEVEEWCDTDKGDGEVDHHDVQTRVAGIGEEGLETLDHAASGSGFFTPSGLMKRP